MAYTPLLLLGVPHLLADAASANELEEIVALPARTSSLAWEVSLDDETPGSIDLVLAVAIELAGPYVAIDTIDETDFVAGAYLVTLPSTAARFVKFTSVQATGMEVTSRIIAKVANP